MGWGPDCVGPCRLWCYGPLVSGVGKESLCKRDFQGVCMCLLGTEERSGCQFHFEKISFSSDHCWEERATGSCGQMEEAQRCSWPAVVAVWTIWVTVEMEGRWGCLGILTRGKASGTC